MSSIESLDELRLAELYFYRSRRRDGRKPPSRAGIDPVDIPHLLPHPVLTEVAGESGNPNHRKAVSRVHGRFGSAPVGTA